MANSSPNTVTITSTIGPGISNAAQVFSQVTNLVFDFIGNTIRITHGNGLTISYYDYSAIATLTWTISNGHAAITIST